MDNDNDSDIIKECPNCFKKFDDINKWNSHNIQTHIGKSQKKKIDETLNSKITIFLVI